MHINTMLEDSSGILNLSIEQIDLREKMQKRNEDFTPVVLKWHQPK